MVVEAVVSLSEKCRGLLSGLLGQLSFSAVGRDEESDARWCGGDWWGRWLRRRRKKAMMQRRMKRAEEPMAIPAMAPALKPCFV